MKNSLFRQMPASFRLLLLASLVLLGAGVGAGAGLGIGMASGLSSQEVHGILSHPAAEHAGLLKWMNNVSQLFTFLLPALLIGWAFGREYRWDPVRPSWILVIGVLWIAGAGGVIDALARINELLIPTGGALERWFKPLEDQAMQLTGIILGDTSPAASALTILTVAIVPAICEEWLFRGTLQPLIGKASGNLHTAVWISAFFFSLIHFQAYGFLPRLFLGAMLGYLAAWTGSLWMPVLAHFAHNAMAIIAFHQFGGQLETPEMPTGQLIGGWVVSTAIVILLGRQLWMRRVPSGIRTE